MHVQYKQLTILLHFFSLYLNCIQYAADAHLNRTNAKRKRENKTKNISKQNEIKTKIKKNNEKNKKHY